MTADDVVLVYEGLLDRTPRPDEIEHQVAHARSLRELLVAVLGSEELAALKHPDPEPEPPAPLRVVNVHTEELAEFGTPPGTWSADGVAVMGRDGWVFLGTGSNAILDQYRAATSRCRRASTSSGRRRWPSVVREPSGSAPPSSR